MATIQQVTVEMFQCSDGKRFEDETAAEEHELRLVLEKLFSDEAPYGQLDVADAVNVIIKHRAALREVLT